MQLLLCLLERSQETYPRDHTPENGVRFWKLHSFLHLIPVTSTWLLTMIGSKALKTKRAYRLVSRSSRGVRTEKTESDFVARFGEKEPHAKKAYGLS